MVDRKERIEHRGHKNRPALVHFGRTIQFGRVRVMWYPLFRLRIIPANEISQGSMGASCVSELSGQLTQEVLSAGKISARLGDLMPQGFGEGEMLKQRDDVGKGFMKC